MFAISAAGEELTFRKLLQDYLGGRLLKKICKLWGVSDAWIDSLAVHTLGMATVSHLFALAHTKPEKHGGSKVATRGIVQLTGGFVFGTLQEVTGDQRCANRSQPQIILPQRTATTRNH